MGKTVQLDIAGQTRNVPVTKAFVGTLLPLPDRIKRSETYQKEWAILDMGMLTLPKGIHTLTIRNAGTSSVPFELKAIQVSKH